MRLSRTGVLPEADGRAASHPRLRMEAALPSNDKVMGEPYYNEERVIDLSLLDPLKDDDVEEDFFVADKLYVRDAISARLWFVSGGRANWPIGEPGQRRCCTRTPPSAGRPGSGRRSRVFRPPFTGLPPPSRLLPAPPS